MIVISGIIIQKNTLCTNKIRVFYFSPNCVNLFAQRRLFFFLSSPDPQPGRLWPHRIYCRCFRTNSVIYDISCIMITYLISTNFCSKKSFFAMLLALQFSINRKNETKKGNTLIDFQYLPFCSSIDSFDVQDE